MKRIPLLLSAFLLLFFAGCGEEEAAENPSTLPALEEESFTLEIPGNWEIFPKTILAKRNVNFGAREANGFGKIETAIVVSSDTIPETSTLDRYTTQSLENIRKRSQNFQKKYEESLDLNGVSAKLVRYTDRNSVDLSEIQFSALFAISGGKGFVAILSLDNAKTDAEKEEMEKILRSFRIKGGTSPSGA